MASQVPDNSARRSRWRRNAIFAGAGLAVAVLSFAVLLILKWPFSRQELTESLQEIVPGDVQMERFRSIFFPHPGCEAENVSVRRSSDAPLVRVQRISIQARYVDLLVRPGYVARILLQGLRVSIPPNGSATSQSGSFSKAGNGGQASESEKTRAGEIITQGAVLEIGRQGGKPPLKFEIHELKLGSVSRSSAFSYEVELTNAIPPGEIKSSGHLGPWNTSDWGKTPVSGSYQFRDALLDALPGIGGTLSSDAHFEGQLDQIDLNGKVDVANFLVKQSKQKVGLHAQYLATVDGMTGDVFLRDVQTSFLHTTVAAKGKVAGQKGQGGKTTSLQVAVRGGRIEDVLGLFVQSGQSPLLGATDFGATIVIPPDRRPFLRKIELQGDFQVDRGRFRDPQTQAGVDDLNRRASGAKDSKETGPAEPAISRLGGHIVLRGGVARFTDVAFAVASAAAQGSGQDNLLNGRIDFHGSLYTEAELSHTTTGIKSVLLKPLNPLFKKKNAGAAVPVAITGTYSEPHFGIDLNPPRKNPAH